MYVFSDIIVLFFPLLSPLYFPLFYIVLRSRILAAPRLRGVCFEEEECKKQSLGTGALIPLAKASVLSPFSWLPFAVVKPRREKNSVSTGRSFNVNHVPSSSTCPFFPCEREKARRSAIVI